MTDNEQFTMKCGCNCHPTWICNWCVEHGHDLDGVIHSLDDMFTEEEARRLANALEHGVELQ